ncbi:MAG: hypothetical protein QOJ90_2911 [Actinomycetota bacterium]|nr:hypothetical protein [Actinomycetota bacterium]
MDARRTLTGGALTVLGGALVVTLTGIVLHRDGAEAAALSATVKGTAATSRGVLPHAFLKLATYPDSMAGAHGPGGGVHPDWVTYGPTSALKVPAHSLVTITIDQYDGGETITNPYFATVRGTVGGTMTVDGKTLTKTSPDAVGHTFTIHAAPSNQDPLFVSVPLPAVAEDAPVAPNSDYPAPHVVTFSFITGGPGEYVWNCEYPCGDGYYAKFGGAMSSRGYMSGTFTVS